MPAQAGANSIFGAGMLESGMTWGHEQFVIDVDVIRMVNRVIQGIEVTDDTLATDIIKQVREIENFLHQRHTIAHMREASQPRLIDRNTRGTWQAQGGTDMTQRAREEARRIIKTHRPDPLPDGARKKIHDIVESATKELVSLLGAGQSNMVDVEDIKWEE